MNVTTLYNVGDTVYAVTPKAEMEHVPCDACSSTGRVDISGVDYTCPKCGGRKTATGRTVHVVQSIVIDRVVVDEGGAVDSQRVRYFGLRDDGKHVVNLEACVFSTKELAEASIG